MRVGSLFPLFSQNQNHSQAIWADRVLTWTTGFWSQRLMPDQNPSDNEYYYFLSQDFFPVATRTVRMSGATRIYGLTVLHMHTNLRNNYIHHSQEPDEFKSSVHHFLLSKTWTLSNGICSLLPSKLPLTFTPVPSHGFQECKAQSFPFYHLRLSKHLVDQVVFF